MISARALRFHRDSSTQSRRIPEARDNVDSAGQFLDEQLDRWDEESELDFTRFVEVGHAQDQDLSRNMVRPVVPEGTRTARKADMSRVLGRGQIMCPYILCPYMLMTPPLDILLPLDTKPKRT